MARQPTNKTRNFKATASAICCALPVTGFCLALALACCLASRSESVDDDYRGILTVGAVVFVVFALAAPVIAVIKSPNGRTKLRG